MSNSSFEISELNYTSDQVTVDFAKKIQKKGLHAWGSAGGKRKAKLWILMLLFNMTNC
jgi:hypothetical protein